MAEIEWVNHSGYVLRTAGGTALLVDPWLRGTAFDDGWALLSPTATEASDLADVRHIWISHEHPDHFSPPSLKALPEAQRRETTVWFRPTRDQRVQRFCEGLGYRFGELPDAQPVQAAPDLVLTCGAERDDSWLLAEADGRRILNVNDCEFPQIEQLQRVAEVVGDVDVLLTQFSYANGISGPDGQARRARSAANKLNAVARQVRAIEPDVVVPFASFVWFCHEENAHLNDEVVTVDRAARSVEDLGVEARVLYPGDRWTVGEEHDDSSAIERYVADHESVASRPLLASETVDPDELVRLGAEHVQRVRERNWLWVLRPLRRHRLLRPLRIQVPDHDGARYTFDLFDALQPDATDEPASIVLSSESLAFSLRHDFGMDTLMVNGRFRELEPDALLRLRVLLGVAELNNHGHTIPGMLFEPEQLRHGVRRLRTRVRRVAA